MKNIYMKSKSKMRNVKVMYDNILFHSKKEAARYADLKLLARGGVIKDLKLQVPFELVPKQPGERAVKYYADFTYYDNRINKFVIEDTKSDFTRKKDSYIIKRKLVKLQYTNEDTVFLEYI